MPSLTAGTSLVAVPRTAVEVLPDSARYKCRFKVRSASSNRLYLVSYDNAPGAGYWTCSCRGNIRYGQCKHLTAAGLRGRKYSRTAFNPQSVLARLG